GVEDSDRLRLDFVLSQEPASALLLGVSSSFLVVVVEHAGPGSSWQTAWTEEQGGRSRRRLLRLSGIQSGDQVRVTLERRRGDDEQKERLRGGEIGVFASDVRLLPASRGLVRGVLGRQLYNGLLPRACV